MLGWQLNMSTLDALSGAKLRIFLHIPKEFSQNLVLSLDLKAVRSFFFPSYHYHDRIFCISEDAGFVLIHNQIFMARISICFCKGKHPYPNSQILPVKNLPFLERVFFGRICLIVYRMAEKSRKYTFEVGGKKKGLKQVQGVENAYIVRDDTEYASGQFLPLWSFGLLY